MVTFNSIYAKLDTVQSTPANFQKPLIQLKGAVERYSDDYMTVTFKDNASLKCQVKAKKNRKDPTVATCSFKEKGALKGESYRISFDNVIHFKDHLSSGVHYVELFEEFIFYWETIEKRINKIHTAVLRLCFGPANIEKSDELVRYCTKVDSSLKTNKQQLNLALELKEEILNTMRQAIDK
jgi:hypothetical protein